MRKGITLASIYGRIGDCVRTASQILRSKALEPIIFMKCNNQAMEDEDE
ncbi:MAG: hypothetical protein NT018_06820 [Armatimonadetes bacterium]|nr:hypothetical protein [Armatimonadota bacterium]